MLLHNFYVGIVRILLSRFLCLGQEVNQLSYNTKLFTIAPPQGLHLTSPWVNCCKGLCGWGGVGGGKMAKGGENPLWVTTWASEPCLFDGTWEHVVVCMFEIVAFMTPFSTLCFPCFANPKQKLKNTSFDKVELKPKVLANKVWECRMKKMINNECWKFPSFSGIWCCDIHPNFVKHVCKTKPTQHKS